MRVLCTALDQVLHPNAKKNIWLIQNSRFLSILGPFCSSSARTFAAPFALIGLEFAHIYGLFRPHDATKLYGAIEQAEYSVPIFSQGLGVRMETYHSSLYKSRWILDKIFGEDIQEAPPPQTELEVITDADAESRVERKEEVQS